MSMQTEIHKASRLHSYGLYSYGLHSYGLYLHGLHSYGLHSNSRKSTKPRTVNDEFALSAEASDVAPASEMRL